MKTNSLKLMTGVLAGLAFLCGIHSAPAQNPVITSFSQNGVLICSNLLAGSTASVQWASSLSGPWQTNWASLAAVTADTNGAITVSVPMFYRVLGVAAAQTGLALIPAGTFIMGNSIGDSDITDANPTNVYVSAFYMDTNLVSYSQWQGVYNYAIANGYSFDNDGSGAAANHPVQTVYWYDVVKWSNARSQQAGLNPVYYTDAGLTQTYTNGDVDVIYVNWGANGYRLPTEAEWEKAARGGLSGQRFPWGPTISWSEANYYGDPLSLDPGGYAYDLATAIGYDPAFDSGGGPYTSPVATFPANGYGLNDMAGNVYEWCWDWYAAPPYPTGSPYLGGTDPRGPASGTYRVIRGGGWFYNGEDAAGCRSANRVISLPGAVDSGYIGFRCVRGS
jgi:formylglycine-generating enzyme required for sulfatase activity